MSRLGEITVFAGLAIGVHVGAWAWMAPRDAGAAGDGGMQVVTLVAASADLQTLVETWDQPAEQLSDAPQLSPPPEPVAAPFTEPAPAIPQQAVALPAHPGPIAAIAPLADAVPQADLTPPEPLPEVTRPPEAAMPPVRETRPVARPAKPLAKSTPRKAAQPKPARTPKPAAKPAAKGGPAAAQKPAGGASGQTAGQSTQEAGERISKSARQSLIADWGGKIRRSIERGKRYPRGARSTGVVKLRVSIAPQGALAGVSVIRSSGDPALDTAAVEAVRKARLPRAPEGLSEARYHFNLPIAFQRR